VLPLSPAAMIQGSARATVGNSSAVRAAAAAAARPVRVERRGERGPPGKAAPTVVNWTLDRKNYRAIPTMSDGRAGTPLELRELFEQFLLETNGAA